MDTYYEEPQVRAPQKNLFENGEEKAKLNTIIVENEFNRFLEIKLENFTIRTDNQCNNHCLFLQNENGVH